MGQLTAKNSPKATYVVVDPKSKPKQCDMNTLKSHLLINTDANQY